MVKYIGITGVAGSGKNAVAEILEHELGTFKGDYDYTARIIPLAKPLKEAIAALFDIPATVLEDREVKESKEKLTGLTYRKIMQLFGTEFVRVHFGSDFWTKRLDQVVKEGEENFYLEYVIVPDVRFQNEADFIKSKGGVLLKVVRPDNPFAIESSHASEAEVNSIQADYVISNISDLGQLENKVLSLIKEIA